MYKLLIGLLFFFIFQNSFAMPDYRAEMRKKLQDQKVSKFNFEDASVSTVTHLIKHEFGITFSFDANVDQNKTAPIRLKNSNFLQFLEVGLNKLDMSYQVVSPNSIKIMAKAQQAPQLKPSLNSPPQLWSDHKQLNLSVGACADKGYKVLQKLGFSKIVQNQFNVYGNFQNNRAAVKCVDQNQQSFVYAMVAGEDVKQVEKLRNAIMKEL